MTASTAERVTRLARRPWFVYTVWGLAVFAAVVAVVYVKTTESTPRKTLRQFVTAAARQREEDKEALRELVTKESLAKLGGSMTDVAFIGGIIDLRIVEVKRRGNAATILVEPAHLQPGELASRIPYKLRKQDGMWKVDLDATAAAIKREQLRNPRLYEEILRRGRDRLAPWEREVLEGPGVPGEVAEPAD
jgi:hypothetical protein